MPYLYGIDLLQDRIEKSKKIYPSYKFFLGDAALMQSIGVMLEVIIMTFFHLYSGIEWSVILSTTLTPS